ncbi:hypothetical protein A6X21_04015 [Planctopirus hydrillae]|uniref:VWFA domain-containing protein n=2 Tax=Planctopirus hydrillae TaxID=1841610 RepID=A0A1C3ENL7_9PLAN|nr:hypothetical protein A6X21_04015 [Planctopirus hydrillae]
MMRKISSGRRRVTHKRHPRRGAIAILAAFVMVALLALAGFFLSLSYVELTRAELRAATDAAARSAVIRLVETQSTSSGRAAARDIASRFEVGGKALSLNDSDIQFGRSTRQSNGSYSFAINGTPTNAARVFGRKTKTSAAGPVELPFGGFVGAPEYSTELNAVAMRLDYDIVIVLDRSGSMGWDLSGVEFEYPEAVRQRPLVENYFSPPDPTGSRWAILSASVNDFLTILNQRQVAARVGLVTYAGDYTFGKYSSVKLTVESDLTSTFSTITSKLTAIGQVPLIGGTDIGAGITAAQTMLTTSSQARLKTGQPIIIVFSDGMFNQGTEPVSLAASAYAQSSTIIHSVTFGATAQGRATMNSVTATAGKGLSLHANTAAELTESFRSIANAIPIVVTE